MPGDRPRAGKELTHQAVQIATIGKLNGGAVCGRVQTLATSKHWPQREAFLTALRQAIVEDSGWNVIATMRSPETETELTLLDNVLVTRLDLTDEASIAAAVDAGVAKFGQIGVLLDNRKALDDATFIGGLKAPLGIA